MMDKDSRIYVAGHTGMVGMSLVRELRERGYDKIITCSRSELDLLDQQAVSKFFERHRPEYVFLAAGKTGGIYANNTYRADFIYENIVMQSNVIHNAFLYEARKLMFYACSCLFPKECPQPMSEDCVLTGPLELTNEPFAVAKIAGMKMCESYNRQYGSDFITLIPTNIYGPNQRYETMNSLVVPSLIQKFYDAKQNKKDKVVIWGSGRPRRDFLFVDDLAEASIFLMEQCEGNVVLNVGTGRAYSISEVVEIVRREFDYNGEVVYDASLPDGVPVKLQDVSKINDLGWTYRVELEEGIRMTCRDYVARQ